MTILPARSITAGLNVPADSHPFPRGEMMGVSEIRRQTPNAELALFCEARAANNGRTQKQARLRIDLIMASLSEACCQLSRFKRLKMPERTAKPQSASEKAGRASILRHLADEKTAELDPHLTPPGR